MTRLRAAQSAASPAPASSAQGEPNGNGWTASAAPGRGEAGDDPLYWVERIGQRASQVGLVVGLLLATGTHGLGTARAFTMLVEMRDAVVAMRKGLHEYLWAAYDVDMVKETEAPKPEEPPEPEPPPPPPPPSSKDDAVAPDDDPYEPVAAAAAAPAIITAPQAPGEPEDLTDDGFVNGPGTGPGFGYVSAAGTATAATYDPRARPDGKEGGHGSGEQKPPPPKVNRSRPANVAGSKSWSCPFPPEADQEQINRATATVVVTVSPSGAPVSVQILSDPGYGFGRAAKQCAMSRRYEPALDASGAPVRATTPPIIVRFKR